MTLTEEYASSRREPPPYDAHSDHSPYQYTRLAAAAFASHAGKLIAKPVLTR